MMALLAALALAIGLLSGPASASGGGTATASSLKKCLKKAKKKRTHHKRKKAKKRCHRRYKHHGTGTSSLVRATLTWDSDPPGAGGDIDLDLWVFDTNGNRARAAADTIPNSSFSSNDVDAPGRETFTDLVYKKPGGRDFSFGVCYQDGGSQHTAYTIDYVTADGTHHTGSNAWGSDGISDTFSGGAPIPANFCKAP